MYLAIRMMVLLHHCSWEVVDNSVDEHLAGHTKQIDIVLNDDHSLSVRDYGRGIPVGVHEEFGISAAEVIMTKLHAGGKFDNSSYKVSGGLHGVGVSAVNAVSEWMEMTIHRDGKVYFQRYEAGVPTADLKKINTCDKDDTGTHISFKPDLTIFTNVTEFNLEEIDTRVSETAFLNAGLKITILDNRGEEPHHAEHLYEGGLAEYVGQLNERREVLHADVITISGDKKIEKGPVEVEVALQWSDAFSESIRCYTNIIRNKDGGTHMSGLRTALTSSVNAYAKKKNLLKGDSLSGDDVREGLAAIVSVKHPDPSFSSQTKDKLVSSEVTGIVQTIVYDKLGEFFEENPSCCKTDCGKGTSGLKSTRSSPKSTRFNAEKAFSKAGVCWKLADCR